MLNCNLRPSTLCSIFINMPRSWGFSHCFIMIDENLSKNNNLYSIKVNLHHMCLIVRGWTFELPYDHPNLSRVAPAKLFRAHIAMTPCKSSHTWQQTIWNHGKYDQLYQVEFNGDCLAWDFHYTNLSSFYAYLSRVKDINTNLVTWMVKKHCLVPIHYLMCIV